MKPFSFKVPTEVMFGEGILKNLPAIVKERQFSKVLVVSGPNVTRKLTKQIVDSFAANDIFYDTFTEIEANPSIETVQKGVDVFKQHDFQCIVCLGGGSPMDTAKAISVVVSNGGSIEDYEGAHKVKKEIIPLVAIPTTAGTGSEVTPFTVITDRQRNYKLTVFSNKIIPDLALLDPSLMFSMPPSVAASTGVDALIHAVEAYLSLMSSPFSDLVAEKAIAMIGKNLRAFVANRSNAEAASEMLLGSMFAGVAFALARLGNIHAMSHPLSGYFNIPHGVANAVLLPVVLEYNALADGGKYRIIHELLNFPEPLWGFEPMMLVDEIRKLLHQLEIPKNLAELGVDKDLIPEMAKDAMKSGNILVNPRKTELSDVEKLYRLAF